jgi:uncharacterized delta-60 repeat protein
VLDGSFGDHGVVTTAIGGSATAEAVAAEPDGDLVSAGFAVIDGVHQLAITRHRADGSLDRRFGQDGVVTTTVGIYPEAQAVVIDDDGKIIVAGKGLASRSTSQLVLARFHGDGSPDDSFGDNGVATTQTGTFAVNMAVGIALTPEGKLVVAVNVGPGGVNNFGVLRFNPDGSRDATFGTDGLVVTEMPAFAAAASAPNCSAAIPAGLVLQPDGKVVVAGSIQLDGVGADRVALVRYDSDGSPDPDFGAGGILITVVESPTGAAVARQSDGRLLVGGTAGGGFGVARYHADGSLDPTFGNGGTASAAISAYVLPSGLLIEPDGRIVVNGSVDLGNNARGIALARFAADGTPDSMFGTNGVTTTVTGPVWRVTGPHSTHHTLICPFRCASPVVRQPDGRLVIADGARNEDDEQPTFRLVRYADGPTPTVPGEPSGHEPSPTTTTTEASGTPAADPPHNDSPALTSEPSSTPTTAAPGETVTTPAPAPTSTRPTRTSAVGAGAPADSSASPPVTTESEPASAQSDDQAAAPATGPDRPAWPFAAVAAAVVVSGAVLAGARRRSVRRAHAQ